MIILKMKVGAVLWPVQFAQIPLCIFRSFNSFLWNEK